MLLGCEGLGFLGRHLPAAAVDLVPDQPDLKVRLALLPQVLQPISRVIEGRPPRDVEHHEGPMHFPVMTESHPGYFIVSAR